MAHRQALATLTNKQTPHLQNGIKTNLDIRTGIMGLRRIIQSSHYPAVRSEDSPTNHQRNKSHLRQGYAYPTSPNCPSGTNRHSSHNTAVSPKPTDGRNLRTAKQQAITKKMDTWCDHLRQRRWTSPRLPPTRINALAHRNNNKSFLCLLILELNFKKLLRYVEARRALICDNLPTSICYFRYFRGRISKTKPHL
jgi:hypothetical protein